MWGGGVPHLVAVHADKSGKARSTTDKAIKTLADAGLIVAVDTGAASAFRAVESRTATPATNPAITAMRQGAVDFLPKLRLEMAVPEHMVEQAIENLCTAAHTGKIGDGKIFVTPIEQAIRIRTGESGDGAL